MQNKVDKEYLIDLSRQQIKAGVDMSVVLRDVFDNDSFFISPLGEVFARIHDNSNFSTQQKDILSKHFPIHNNIASSLVVGSRGYGYYMLFGNKFTQTGQEIQKDFKAARLGSSFYDEINDYLSDLQLLTSIKELQLVILDNMRSQVLCIINLITVLQNPHVISKYNRHNDKIDDAGYLNKLGELIPTLFVLYQKVTENYKFCIDNKGNGIIEEDILKEIIESLQNIVCGVFKSKIELRTRDTSLVGMLDNLSAFGDIFFTKLLRNFREEDNPLIIYTTIERFLSNHSNIDKDRTLILGIQYGGIECGMIGSLFNISYGTIFFSKYFANNYRGASSIEDIPCYIQKGDMFLSDLDAITELLKESHIIICDDNVASGSTISTLRNIIEGAGAMTSQIIAIRFMSVPSESPSSKNIDSASYPILGNVISKSYFQNPSRMLPISNDAPSYRHLLITKKQEQLSRDFKRHPQNF